MPFDSRSAVERSGESRHARLPGKRWRAPRQLRKRTVVSRSRRRRTDSRARQSARPERSQQRPLPVRNSCAQNKGKNRLTRRTIKNAIRVRASVCVKNRRPVPQRKQQKRALFSSSLPTTGEVHVFVTAKKSPARSSLIKLAADRRSREKRGNSFIPITVLLSGGPGPDYASEPLIFHRQTRRT